MSSMKWAASASFASFSHLRLIGSDCNVPPSSSTLLGGQHVGTSHSSAFTKDVCASFHQSCLKRGANKFTTSSRNMIQPPCKKPRSGHERRASEFLRLHWRKRVPRAASVEHQPQGQRSGFVTFWVEVSQRTRSQLSVFSRVSSLILSFTANSSLFLSYSQDSHFRNRIGIQDGGNRVVSAEAGQKGCQQVSRSEQLQADSSGCEGDGSVWSRPYPEAQRAQRAEMSRLSTPTSLGNPRSAGWPGQFGKSSYIAFFFFFFKSIDSSSSFKDLSPSLGGRFVFPGQFYLSSNLPLSLWNWSAPA